MTVPFLFDNFDGIQEEFLNTASMRNQGIDLTLVVAAVRTPVIGWDVSVNAWGNQNRVESLGSGRRRAGPFGYLVSPGYALYAIPQSTLTYAPRTATA